MCINANNLNQYAKRANETGSIYLEDIWAGQELYRKGNSKEIFYNILQKNMRPVYDSAKRQGYEVWGKS